MPRRFHIGGALAREVRRGQRADLGVHYGLNSAGYDNQQFTLNLMHWMAGRLQRGAP